MSRQNRASGQTQAGSSSGHHRTRVPSSTSTTVPTVKQERNAGFSSSDPPRHPKTNGHASSSSTSSASNPYSSTNGHHPHSRPTSSYQGHDHAPATRAFWSNEALVRHLAFACMPITDSVLALARVNKTTYHAAMSVFLERIELSRNSLEGIHHLFTKKQYLAKHVRELAISDNWRYNEVWLSPTGSVPSYFAQFWPPLAPFQKLADVFQMVSAKNVMNEALRIDIALDFWCLKAMYEVFRAQRAAAARVRALRITGAAPVYKPPGGVKSEDKAAFLLQFEGIMWNSLISILNLTNLSLFQVLPRGGTKEVVQLPASLVMSLADLQPNLETMKLHIFPEHKWALMTLARHNWYSLTSFSVKLVDADQYPAEIKELDTMLGKKWLDLTELRIEYWGNTSDALKWSWSHPNLKILDADMSTTVDERIIRFVHDHPSIEHLSLHSDQRCKRPTRYPPKLRSCAIILKTHNKDPFAAAVESNATYVTAVLSGRNWKQDLSSAVPWIDRLASLTALDLVIDAVQFQSVCSFFGAHNALYFPHLLEICLITWGKFELESSKMFQTGLDFFQYAIEELRYLPRIQVVALNSENEALDKNEVKDRLFKPAPSLRAAAWLTTSEEAQLFAVEHVPQIRRAVLQSISPYMAGFSRLDCGQEERGWPYDYNFFLHSPDGRAIPRCSLVSFPG
ncbi:hypothetical protein OC846_004251 [Tilletia horrida]|uniref:Uncharacterized protein n=1 Tax=Tilletia horrida TaxID=155126 RepID=A0AAN6GP14_9BASI|nr:hypothetical protein OC846_004251 [Tilletia horrida]